MNGCSAVSPLGHNMSVHQSVSSDEGIKVAREQIAKMRDEYALERRANLKIALGKPRISPTARKYLIMAIESQKSFELQANEAKTLSNALLKIAKNYD